MAADVPLIRMVGDVLYLPLGDRRLFLVGPPRVLGKFLTSEFDGPHRAALSNKGVPDRRRPL